MDINLIEMMGFCIALLDYLGSLANPLTAMDDAAIAAALPDLAASMVVMS